MISREEHLSRIKEDELDALIIGGGINGAVAAAALSSRGIRVGLIEKNDFASFTSQESSNLIWGGIKYLENLEFSLVNHLCLSRNRLLDHYPDNVKEIRFLALSEHAPKHSPLLMSLGTWFYWLIGRCRTKPPSFRKLGKIMHAIPEVDLSRIVGGTEYSDAYLPDGDARFVFSFIRHANNHGAMACNYTQACHSEYDPQMAWATEVKDHVSGDSFTIKSKIIINATGAYVDAYNQNCGIESRKKHVLSKGVHLVFRRLINTSAVLTFFADDGRPFFIIPHEHFSVIGTTDTIQDQPESKVSEDDRRFILSAANERLRLDKPLTKSDIVTEMCGVRPLVIDRNHSTSGNDWFNLSRKHHVDVNYDKPYISIFGGKLTDCLNVGEEISQVVENVLEELPHPYIKWFGEANWVLRKSFIDKCSRITSPTDMEAHAHRLWRRYGTGAEDILKDVLDHPHKNQKLQITDRMLRAEIEYLKDNELICTLNDLFRRRSTLGLEYGEHYLSQHSGLKEIAEILFDHSADEKIAEFKNSITEEPSSPQTD